MKEFTLTVNTENSAVEQAVDLECLLFYETQRIRAKIISGVTSGKILDDNGNTVGSWEWK